MRAAEFVVGERFRLHQMPRQRITHRRCVAAVFAMFRLRLLHELERTLGEALVLVLIGDHEQAPPRISVLQRRLLSDITHDSTPTEGDTCDELSQPSELGSSGA